MNTTITEYILACDSVQMGYGRTVILPDVRLHIAPGAVLGIVGPNGAGKTTLLKTLLGIIPPVQGGVSFPAGREAVRFGYVPQRQVVDETYPLTAADVVLMGRYGRLGPMRRPGQQDRARAQAAIDAVGLTAVREQAYRELSGGQKQRILIARALVGEPTVLVLDEPTTDMDLASERAILDLVAQLHAEQGLTILVVSHLLHVVLNLATQVALVDHAVTVVPIAEARTTACLSDFYGVPVCVAEVDGRYVAV